MRKLLVLLLVGFASATLTGQETVGLSTTLNWAMANHPIAAMADAVAARGAAELLRAKGAFDPKVAAAYDRKEFLGTEYFNYGETGVEWQSPYAVKISAGFQWARGTYLTDELTVPDAGQSYLAVKLPILQGLITDAARIDRQRGDVALERQRALAEVIRNELRFDLSVRFAAWQFAERALAINQETQDLLETYLINTRELYRQGDKPAVDTLEATVYLGTQRLATQQAVVDARLARQALAELYWPLTETDRPARASDALIVLPPAVDWVARHPELAQLQLSVTDYQLEQRLKREKLKPKLDLSYYLLGNGLELPAGGDQYGGPFDRAYKIGATASYPILNRKARGAVQLGELKIREGEAKLSGKRQSLQTKVTAYADAAATYGNQLQQATTLIDQAQRLLAAERELFGLGESTQFLLNARQQSLQKALLVAEKLRFSRDKAVFTYRYLVADWEG